MKRSEKARDPKQTSNTPLIALERIVAPNIGVTAKPVLGCEQ